MLPCSGIHEEREAWVGEMPDSKNAQPGGPLDYPRWRSADQAARGRPWLSHGKPRLQTCLFSACPLRLPAAPRVPRSWSSRPASRPAGSLRPPSARPGGRARAQRSRRRGRAQGAPQASKASVGAAPCKSLPVPPRSQSGTFPPRSPAGRPVCAALCGRPLTHSRELSTGRAGLRATKLGRGDKGP